MFSGKFFIQIISNLLLFCSPLFLTAQSPHFKNYSVKEGLPSSETYQVFQDSKGYIWIATDKGVAKFDGYEFKIFTTQDGLADNTIFGFYEDNLGRIWFRSFSGKLSYYKDDKITCLKINEELQKKLKKGIVNSMVFKEDTLWLGTISTNTLFKICWDKKGNEKLLVEHLNISGGHYLYIIDKDNVFHGGGELVNVPKSNTDSWITIFNRGKFVNKISFQINKKGASPNNKCIKYKNKYFLYSVTNRIALVNSENGAIEKAYTHEAEWIIYLYKDSKGGLWIGTYKQGVYYYPDGDLNGKAFRYLDSKSVSAITEDTEGGIWLSTLENGISYIPHTAYKHYSLEKGDLSSKIFCMKVIKNELWVGLDNGFVKVFTDSTDRELSFNYERKNNYIKHIASHNDGTVGIGTAKGYFVMDGLKSKGISYTKEFSGVALQSAKDNVMWIGETRRLLHVVRKGGKYITRKISFTDKIHAIAEDNTGKIWLGSMQGLWHYDSIAFIKDQHPQLQGRINDLKISKENVFWMATKGNGIYLKKENDVFQIKNVNGLSGDICQSIVVVADSIAWIGTNKGLSKVTIHGFTPFAYKIENYTTQNGLLSDEINVVDLKGDTIYAATNDGITFFDKTKVKPNKVMPPIYITKLQVNDSLFHLSDNYALTYNQNTFRISYVGLTYKAAGNTEYKYRLLGLDTTWNYTKYTTANFTTLPYGNYTFEVYAKNNDGYWSRKPAIMNFRIAPPFWHTWWFRLLAGISLIAGTISIIRYRVRIIEKREHEKTELYKKAAEAEKESAELYKQAAESEREKLDLFQKASEMEMKFLSAQMNPHFTFNAMNSIQHFMLDNEPEKAQKYLAKYSKLIRRVLENNMQKFVPLEDEVSMLELYLEIEAMRFSQKFEFEIIISEELRDDVFEIPPMIIQPYIENAIWHGIFNKQGGSGRIELSFSLEAGRIKCVIEDNGVGREKAKTLKKDPKGHRSVGMLITSQRLQYLQSDSSQDIKSNIIDLKDKEGNDCGTRVEIYLPVNKGRK